MNALLGLQNPNNPGRAFQHGFAQSRARREREEKKQAIEDQRKEKQRQAQVTGNALTGRGPREAVAYFDPDMYLKLQGNDRTQAKESLQMIGQALQRADTPQAFDQLAAQMGPEFQSYIGRFNERDAILAQAGQLTALMDQEREDSAPSIGYVPADAQAYAKNQAGENVLKALNGQQPQSPQGGGQGGAPPPENPNPQNGPTMATPEQVAQVTQAFGGDQAKTQAYLQRNNIIVQKQLSNGQMGYLVNGEWYDNPEGR